MTKKILLLLFVITLLSISTGCGYIAALAPVVLSSKSSSSGASNTPPVAAVTTPSGTQSDVISISYTLSDAESHNSSVKVEFAVGTSSTFVPCTEKSGQGDGAKNLAPGPHTFAWDSAADLGSLVVNSIKIRVTPSDASEGTQSTTAAFKVDNNTAPSVSFTAPSGTLNGDITINYSLSDAESDNCSIVISYSTDGVLYKPAVEKSGGASEGTVGLTSSPGGTLHTFVWDSAVNLPGQLQNTVYIKIKPIDFKAGAEVSSYPNPFIVDNVGNQKPSATMGIPYDTGMDKNATQITVNLSGRIRVPYKLIDPESNPCSITAEYSTDLGTNWNTASQGSGGTGVDSPMTTGLASSPSGTGGTSHLFEWNSFADLPSGDTVVIFRITPDDGTGGGTSGTSVQFRVDHSAEKHKFSSRQLMPTPRSGAAVVTINNRIYAIGGELSPGSFSAVVQEYNPFANSWTASGFTAMPTGRAFAACGVFNNEIYVIGGKSGVGALGIVEIYNPATGAWRTGASMLTARFGCAAAVVGNFIYVFGGDTGVANSLKVEAYDPINNVWSNAFTDMPLPARKYMAIAVAERASLTRIYVIGGDTALGSIGDVDEYTPNSDTWNDVNPPDLSLGKDRYGATAAVMDNIIYLFGGKKLINYLNDSFYFSPGGTWSTVSATMPSSRVFLRASVFQNKIYLLGGEASGGLSAGQNEAFEPGKSTWRNLNAMAISRFGLSVGLIGDRLYACGGATATDASGGASNLVANNEEYDFWTNTWTAKASLLRAIGTRAGAVGFDGALNREALYVFGGVGVPADDKKVQRYDPQTDQWLDVSTSMPNGRPPGFAWAQAENVQGVIYIFGNDTNFVDKYDPGTNGFQANIFDLGQDNLGSGVYGGLIYLGGCRTRNNVISHDWFEIFDPNGGSLLSPPTTPNLPTGGALRAQCSVEGLFGKIFLIGGSTSASSPLGIQSTVHKYDITNNAFEVDEPDIPGARRTAASEVWNQKIHVVGGLGNSQAILSSLVEFRP